ncbi:unnamed protein product, partial [Urochloa humidicola]
DDTGPRAHRPHRRPHTGARRRPRADVHDEPEHHAAVDDDVEDREHKEAEPTGEEDAAATAMSK